MCRITRGHAHEETQKLQPSISFLVVFGRAPKNLASNYREFPVAHQWKHQLKRARMKPRQCNMPKRRGQGPNISAIDIVACGLWHPNSVQETRHPRSQASPAVWGTRALVISATMGQQWDKQRLQQEPKSQCAGSLIAKDREETNIAAIDLFVGGLWDCQSISVRVVAGRVSKTLADNSREVPVAHEWQHLMKPVECNCNIVVANHPWPRTEEKTKVAAINLFPCGLWKSQLDTGRQVTKVSCGASVATPNETRTMQCAETPVAKDQKLQPSISLLVVFERIDEILADNYREFPVVHQWHSLRKKV